MTGIITDIQRFSIHDGPGIRTTVFFKGCPLRCVWCHNPETQSAIPQPQLNATRCVLCGGCEQVCPNGCHKVSDRHIFDSASCASCLNCVKSCRYGALETVGYAVDETDIMKTVLRDTAFYGSNGGITLSGGEPTLQHAFANRLLALSKQSNLTTCIETCGIYLDKIDLSLCDTIYFDIKSVDPAEHLALTGVSNQAIQHNLALAAAQYADRITIRFVVVSGLTDSEAHVKSIKEAALFNRITKIEALEFHPYGSSKSEATGRQNTALGKDYIPSAQTMEKIRALLQ